MLRFLAAPRPLATIAALALALAACAGQGDAPASPASPARPGVAGQNEGNASASLEATAWLEAGGVGGITQLPDGHVVINYHPFYAPKVQVALLNADRRSTTPYPNAEWQSCKGEDGRWKAEFRGCLDWVLGLHTDANGTLWLLDSAKSTDQAAGRPARLVPKLVAWNTRENRLERVIEIGPEPRTGPHTWFIASSPWPPARLASSDG